VYDDGYETVREEVTFGIDLARLADWLDEEFTGQKRLPNIYNPCNSNIQCVKCTDGNEATNNQACHRKTAKAVSRCCSCWPSPSRENNPLMGDRAGKEVYPLRDGIEVMNPIQAVDVLLSQQPKC
jgi:hypothetical protein